jgi:uncharacterized membrane protein YdbT with pleckstrin-like domain
MVPIAAVPGPAMQEQTLWQGAPSWMLLVGKVVAIVVVLIALPIAAHFAAAVAGDLETGGRIVRIGWLVTAAVVLFQLVAFLLALARLLSLGYTITNQRVIVESGMLTKSLSEIDLRYIDDTRFFQSVTHRLLGIGDVTIVSSDKQLPTLVLRGVRDPRGVRELIRSSAYQASQRQVFTRAT